MLIYTVYRFLGTAPGLFRNHPVVTLSAGTRGYTLNRAEDCWLLAFFSVFMACAIMSNHILLCWAWTT